MKKILALTVLLALVASAAMACPNDKGAKGASASAASTGAGQCSAGMSAGQCSKMHCDGAEGASATKSMKMEHTTFAIAGLKADKDAKKIQAAFASMKGVNDVNCDLENGTAVVCHNGTASSAACARKLATLGYKAEVVTADMSENGGSCPYAKGASAGKACPHSTTGAKVSTGSGSKDKTL